MRNQNELEAEDLSPPSVESYLNSVVYGDEDGYVPSEFALEFINFIKLVNGSQGEENLTPVLHYRMLDQVRGQRKNIVNMLFRGAAKTTILGEYLFLYLGVYGSLPGFGEVPLALYVSDSIENGVKNMRKNLEYRWENSDFLKKYIPNTRFTDVRWEFGNIDGNVFIVKGYGAKALSLDSVLYTEDNVTTIGACKVGDRIYGPDGQLASIIEKSEIFHKPMYELSLKDGRKLKVSEDHINSVVINTNPNNTLRLEEFNLTTDQLLSIPLTHTKKGNVNHKGTSSKSLVFVKNTQALDYAETDLPIDPYTLGVVLGDGRIQKPNCSVELTTHIDDLPTYRKHIPYTFGKGRFDKRNPNTWTQSIRALGPGLKAMNLGVHGNDKFIPEQYFYGSINQRLALLQGLMDTDGTVTKTGRTYFCSVSPKLLAGVMRLARSLGATASTNKKFNTEIWLNMPMFRLPRKLARQRYDRKDQLVAVESIIPIPNEPSQCIAIDNADRQFLANDYFRTHNTGVRGSKEMGVRPVLAILDDLVSDEDARSATVIASIEDTVYKAIDYALHPTKSKVIWSGTPFNSRDPLYKAVESGAWYVNVYPVCERFPCTRTEFAGAWEDRFTYDYVKGKYDKALKAGKIDTFNQELMLRIMSDEDRLILDADIRWYERKTVLANRGKFNFYMTTDFATSEKTSADYSVISVWAYNSNGDWLWVDGVCKKQDMGKNVDDVFRLAQMYKVQGVGVEVSGQQGGFVPWIQNEMLSRNNYFTLTSDQNGSQPGIRPNSNKMVRFNTVVPMFKQGKIYFPLEMKKSPQMIECMDELSLAAKGGFKSKHDDFIDTISMLSSMGAWKPSQDAAVVKQDGQDLWGLQDTEEDLGDLNSYLV